MSSAKSEIQKRYEREFKDIYKELEKKRKKIEDEYGPSNTDGLFKTYVGKEYEPDSSKSLMVVGKATAGWDRIDAEGFVMEEVVTGEYNSAFWRFIIKLSTELNNTDYHKDALQRIVWSNIMKIGIYGGNPYGDAYTYQRELCIELLKKEIEYLKPARLVFVTGDDYLYDVLQVIGIGKQIVCIDDEKMKPEAYKLKLQPKSLIKNCSVFLTRHPQGWTLEDRKCAEKAIISGRSQVTN